jgi:hypothetical protein
MGPEPVGHYGEENCVLPLPKIELRIPFRLIRSLVTRFSVRLIASDVTHGFISHAVGSFETANPMEQSVRFHTMGPRHSYEAVKLEDAFFASLSQGQRRISITFRLYFKVTSVAQSASAYSMTSRKSIPMPTACEIDVTVCECFPFYEDNWHSELTALRYFLQVDFSGALCVQQVASRGDASDLYFWGTWFESWTEHKLSLFRFLLVFFSPYRQMSGYCLKFGQGRFLPQPSLFIIQESKYNSTLYILSYL